jgi:hypothetical protein
MPNSTGSPASASGSAGARFRQDGTWDPERRNGGISPRDQAQLFACAIDAPDDIRFTIVNGISSHRFSWMSLAEARQLGYEPEDGTAFPNGAGKTTNVTR